MGSVPSKVLLCQLFQWLNIKYKDIWADHRSKKLHTGQAIFLFIEAALQKRANPGEMAKNLRSKPWMQEWLGIESIAPSSLNRKLNEIPTDLLQDIFREIVKEIAGHYEGLSGVDKLGKLGIIDSTCIPLPRNYGSWAYVSSDSQHVKAHTLLLAGDNNSISPEKIVLSTGCVSDQDKEVLQHLKVDSDCTALYDRGYSNYSNFKKWVDQKTRFVCRVKANSKLRILEKREIPAHSKILLDADVELINPETKEPFVLRLVEYEYMDRNKLKTIRVVTNRRDVTAEEVSDLYRYRWKIENFFKWMKQHVKLAKLYSYKETAVWNQIYMSFIAYALCELIRLRLKPNKTCWGLLELIKAYADQAYEAWKAELERKSTKTSKGRQKKKKRGRPRKRAITPKSKRVLII